MCFVRDPHGSGSLGLILCSLKVNHKVMLFPVVVCVVRDRPLDKAYVRHLVCENEVWRGVALGPLANLGYMKEILPVS